MLLQKADGLAPREICGKCHWAEVLLGIHIPEKM